MLLILATILNTSPVWAAPIQVEAQTIKNSTLPKNAIRVPFLRLKLSTESGTQMLSSLTIGRTGLSSSDDLGRIWAETDDYRRTTARQLNNDDQAELEFRTPLAVSASAPEWVTIYANVNSSNNRTIGLKLLSLNSQTPLEVKAEPKVNAPKAKSKPSRSRKATYDRSKFRIKCKNSRCQLVPRD